MGWLWSSKEIHNNIEPSPTNAPPQPNSPPSSPKPDNAPPPPPLTRDQIADAELLAFFKSLQDEPTPQPPTQTTESLPQEPPPHSTPTSTTISTPITPAALHPTSMSCRAAFDTAFHCQSLGGQFNSIYRQGGMRDCRELWGNFWFCMRTNRGWMSDEERREKILEHYRRRERKYVDGPSSEDVWRARERMVVGAFEGDFEAVERWEKAVKEGGADGEGGGGGGGEGGGT